MALAPALDLRPANDGLPANIEAEQALLGVALYDNEAYHRAGGLEPEHFAEAVHGRLWAAIGRNVSRGMLADPTLLAKAFEADDAFKILGGVAYLADMVNRCPPVSSAADYARAIRDHATERALIGIAGEIAAEAKNPDLTAREKVESAEQRLFGLGEHGAKANGGPVAFSRNLTAAIESAAEAYSRDGGLTGISTGLTDLDAKLGGLHPSDLIILAARPSMGKSALAGNIAFNVARRYAYEALPDGSRRTTAGGVVLVFSLEMSGAQLATRIVSEVSGVPSDKVRRGQITAAEYGRLADAATEIEASPLFIDDTGGLSIARLRTRARRLKRTAGLDLVIVDYLQLVTASATRRGDNRVNEVSEVTMELKALAKELNVPVIAAAQLSRNVEARDDKRPQLSDLRESGSIEQDADVVAFIYREEYYLQRSEPKLESPEYTKWREAMDAAAGQAEIIIGKQRHGPIGVVRAHFDESLTKFSDLARVSRLPDQVRFPYGDG